MKIKRKLARFFWYLSLKLDQGYGVIVQTGQTLPKDGIPTQEDFETIPGEPKGHVVTLTKQDKQWRPHQSGGVIVAEPDAMTMARERGENVDVPKTR